MKESIETEIIPERELFYNNDFGVYACSVDDNTDIERNTFGNIVINGAMPKLAIGRKYIVSLERVEHKKHGKGFEVKWIKQDLPTTVEGQHAFLKTIINESYAESIIAKYPTQDVIKLIREGDLDYKKIKGIGEVVFRRIQNSVNDNYEIQEALVELSKYGVTYRIIKKLISHFGGSPSTVVQKVKTNIYSLTEVDSLGFIKVDEYALTSGVEKESPFRILAAIEYVLKEEESNGHCWLSKDTLIDKVTEVTALARDIIVGFLEQDDFQQSKKFNVHEDRIGLQRNYYYESKIADFIKELLTVKGNFKVDNLEEKIKEIEQEQGFEFTDEQKQAILMAVEHNVIVISGRAGSGKTSILKGIIRLLSKYTYETCALSGKAAQRIIESTGLDSKTIHRLLGFTPNEGFLHNHDNRLPADVVVLDEGSMVNNQLSYSLFSAIKEGGKLIILGDVEQLAPIGAGAVLKDLIDSGVVPVAELTQVHRQALKSGILLAANEIRDGNHITEYGEIGNKVIGELKDLIIYSRSKGDNLQKQIIDICTSAKPTIDVMDFQVIVPMKTRGSLSTKELNLRLQPIFNPSEDEGLKRNGYEFRVGDKIIKRGNDYDNGVFNGTLGTIKWIDLGEAKAGFEFVGVDDEVTYSQEEMKNIDMAYALTCHSTQGSQFKNVLLAVDFSAYALLSKQWIYTGITRASRKCVFIFENDALRFAISKNDVIKRNTYLKDMLRVKSVDGGKE